MLDRVGFWVDFNLNFRIRVESSTIWHMQDYLDQSSTYHRFFLIPQKKSLRIIIYFRVIYVAMVLSSYLQNHCDSLLPKTSSYHSTITTLRIKFYILLFFRSPKSISQRGLRKINLSKADSKIFNYLFLILISL